MQIGNHEVDPAVLVELRDLGFFVVIDEEHSTVDLAPLVLRLENGDLLRALQIVGELQPDECEIKEGRLSLWWD